MKAETAYICLIYIYIYIYISHSASTSMTAFASPSSSFSSSFTALLENCLEQPPRHLHSRLSAAHTPPSPTEHVKILLHPPPLFHTLRPFPSHKTNSRAGGGSRWAAAWYLFVSLGVSWVEEAAAPEAEAAGFKGACVKNA
jgi:hypothetical protein